MKTHSKPFLALAVAAGLIGASGAFAQDAGQPAQGEPPAAAQDDMQGMMGGETNQGGGMEGMMGMMNMMAQMNEMMGACTKMMQAMTPNQNAPDQQQEQGNPG